MEYKLLKSLEKKDVDNISQCVTLELVGYYSQHRTEMS